MSRPMLFVAVALASYAVLSSVASLVVMALWRSGRLAGGGAPAAQRAQRLLIARSAPAVGALALVALLVVPAFAAYEPAHAFEAVGPALWLLSGCGVALLANGCARAIASVLATRRIERAWLRSARPLDFDPPAGIPAYAVEAFAPAVALVGVFTPKLIAARAVVEACDRAELANIIAHERGHLHARDNLKRWLMASAPDVLRFGATHRAILTAWDDAAEDAADDAATAGHEVARVDLAALLVKVARLSEGSNWTAATVSPLIAAERLDRRVRRLLSSTHHPHSSRAAAAPSLAAAGLAALLVTALGNDDALKTVHGLVELMVAFGR